MSAGKGGDGRGLPSVSESVRRLNPHVFGPVAGARRPDPEPVTYSGSPERDLQAEVERFLDREGYKRLTPGNAERFANTAIPGWYGHMVSAPRNPFMPDIFICAHGRAPLLVELKTRKHFGRGQLEMINGKWWQLARNLTEFVAIFTQWAGGGR